ncbi:hypothetical protein B0J13DRAFT_540581, partial [Dactylonectria estremocensis]
MTPALFFAWRVILLGPRLTQADWRFWPNASTQGWNFPDGYLSSHISRVQVRSMYYVEFRTARRKSQSGWRWKLERESTRQCARRETRLSHL